MAHIIDTERFRLLPFDEAFLVASLAGDLARASALCGLELPSDWPDEPKVLERRLKQLRAQPDWAPWLTRLIEQRATRKMVGVIGFHGPPGAEALRDFAPEGCEFGYTVQPEFRRQGIATESSRALIAWARTKGVTQFVLSIDANNIPSTALAQKLGFHHAGHIIHPERGEEQIYRRLEPPPPHRD